MASKFTVGELVNHKLFGYRGVVIGVDENFEGTDQWYDFMTRTRPPKDKPWYHVLVHDAEHRTYVAERNLDRDPNLEPIAHPELWLFFDRYRNGVYSLSMRLN